MKGSAYRVARRLEKISLSIASLTHVVRARGRPWSHISDKTPPLAYVA
jgi:hypothetical protein